MQTVQKDNFGSSQGSCRHWCWIHKMQPSLLSFNGHAICKAVQPKKTIMTLNLYSVYPPAHISSLLHWKILTTLIFQTGNSENLIHLDRQELMYKCTKTEEIQVSDAHLHVDMICKTDRSSDCDAQYDCMVMLSVNPG